MPLNTNKPNQPGRVILASASERRRKILAELGLTFEVAIQDVEEDVCAEHPEAVAQTNARRKLNAAKVLFPNHWIIAADTIVDFNGQAIHKPTDLDQAFDFFCQFSGHTHRVLTATALHSPRTPEPTVQVTASSVTFRPLEAHHIRAYFQVVDPMDKAGAYDIDQHPDLIIESYKGSLTNIVGLPVEVVRPWLEHEGRLASANNSDQEPQQP